MPMMKNTIKIEIQQILKLFILVFTRILINFESKNRCAEINFCEHLSKVE